VVKKFSLQEVLDHSAPGPLLVIAGVQDPGNLGTILRALEESGLADNTRKEPGSGDIDPRQQVVIERLSILRRAAQRQRDVWPKPAVEA